MKIKGKLPSPKARLGQCWRCFRTLAQCGEDHYVGVQPAGVRASIEWHRLCCFCVIELNAFGVEGIIVAKDRLSLCPVLNGDSFN
jgi:hypothetical protein